MNASIATVGPATINRRFIAYVLDGLFAGIISLVLFSSFAGGQLLVASALGAITSAAYFAVTWTQFGATPAQRLLGMRTVNATDSARLTPGQAILRWAILYGPASLFVAIAGQPGAGAAYLLAIGYSIYLYYSTKRDPQLRGFHDRKSDSMVVRMESGTS